MKMKVLVKIKVNYIWEGSDRWPCHAKVIATFPTGVPNIVHSQKHFFYEKLHPDWGYPTSEEGRESSYRLSTSNWGELEEKVEKFIEEQIEILNQIKKENEEKVGNKPKDRDEIYVI